ncbi:hypothetical protein [Streptomyces sp. TP-A0356]|uniref:hypothetical protein n=1 Tax=Streptomyces sp. TP-A0356 TaxID=1359208 RepID=UPI0006E1A4E2|nr:hypothetical protein [Streptomyces sp. TP-A0356]
MEIVPVERAQPAHPGAAVTEPANRPPRGAQAVSARVGAATAWDLLRMAFASVAPPGPHRVPGAEGACGGS